MPITEYSMAGPYQGKEAAAAAAAAAAGAGGSERPAARLRSPRDSNEQLQQHDSPTDTLGFPLGPHEAHWAAGLRPHTRARGPGLPACLNLLTEPFHLVSCSVVRGGGGGVGGGGGNAGCELPPIPAASSSDLYSSQLPSSNYLVHYPYDPNDTYGAKEGLLLGGTAVAGVDPRGLVGATAPPGPASATDELEASQSGRGAVRQAMGSAPLPPPLRASQVDAAAARPAAGVAGGKAVPYTDGGGGGSGLGVPAIGTPVATPAPARAELQGKEGGAVSRGSEGVHGAEGAEGRGQVGCGRQGGTAGARSVGEAVGAGAGAGNRGAGPAAMPLTRLPRNSG